MSAVKELTYYSLLDILRVVVNLAIINTKYEIDLERYLVLKIRISENSPFLDWIFSQNLFSKLT